MGHPYQRRHHHHGHHLPGRMTVIMLYILLLLNGYLGMVMGFPNIQELLGLNTPLSTCTAAPERWLNPYPTAKVQQHIDQVSLKNPPRYKFHRSSSPLIPPLMLSAGALKPTQLLFVLGHIPARVLLWHSITHFSRGSYDRWVDITNHTKGSSCRNLQQ